jgi:hypothetical protein
LAEPGGRGSAGQSGVRPSGVVMAEPIGKSVLARLGGDVGLRVGPLAQAGLDEPLSVTVAARGVGLVRMQRSLKVPHACRQGWLR